MTGEHAKNTIFLHRHLPGGRAQLVSCTMGLLGPDDAEQSIALQDRVAKGLSGDIYLPSEESDIVRYLNGDGITIGVWFEDRLVCARTIKTNEQWTKKALAEIDEPVDPGCKTAVSAYTIVDKEFRGNNTQFLSYYMMESLLADGFDMIVTTVAPKNIFSLLNVMSCGFYITGLRDLYGDYLRYILKKQLSTSKPLWTNWHHSIPIRSVEQQQQALREGNVGYKLVNKMRGFYVLYGSVGDAPPKDQQRYRPRPPIKLL